MPVEYLLLFLAIFTLISIGILHPLGIMSFVAFVTVFAVHFCQCEDVPSETQSQLPVETPVETPVEIPNVIQSIVQLLHEQAPEPDDFEIV
uniref:Uncharacterized protein n=1 Tax=viral metagenome TaxID=1070528 RepID=A0A6C0CLF3_9ZZZZ